MIGFTQYLTEARMAPLFHATGIGQAHDIIKHDTFRGGVSHPTPGNVKYRYNSDGWANLHKDKAVNIKNNTSLPTRGVSFSRSFTAAVKYGFHDKFLNAVVVFEIDQLKLAQRNKIMPVSYIGAGNAGDRNLGVARTQKDLTWVDGERAYIYTNEYEEYVLGDVKGVERLITKIHVCSPLTEELIQKGFPLLWNHPLLFDSTRNNVKGHFYNNGGFKEIEGAI